MHPLLRPGMPWGIALLVAAMLLQVLLIFDIDRAVRTATGKPSRPRLFFDLPGASTGRRWLLGLGFVLVFSPYLLAGPFGLPRSGLLPALVGAAVLGLSLAAAAWMQRRARQRVALCLNVLSALVLAWLLLQRYVDAGRDGALRYLAIVGGLAAIVALCWMAWRAVAWLPAPRTKAGAWLRVVGDVVLLVASLAIYVPWPR